MHLITRVLGPGISLLPLLAAGQGFVETCFYKGARFTDNFLGMYCLNNDAVIYGYNWTWYVDNKSLGNIAADFHGKHDTGNTGYEDANSRRLSHKAGTNTAVPSIGLT